MAALKSENTTQKIIEVNFFYSRPKLSVLLTASTVHVDPESGTFAASWRATHAQPSWSAYLCISPHLTWHEFTICFVFGVIIILVVDEYGMSTMQLGSVTAPAVTVYHCSQKLLSRESQSCHAAEGAAGLRTTVRLPGQSSVTAHHSHHPNPPKPAVVRDNPSLPSPNTLSFTSTL